MDDLGGFPPIFGEHSYRIHGTNGILTHMNDHDFYAFHVGKYNITPRSLAFCPWKVNETQ